MIRKMVLLFLPIMILLSASTVSAYTDVEVDDRDYYTRFANRNISINVYNWGEYISDGSDDTLNVNKAFEELTGIKVYYSNFASNEELYAKLKSGGAAYDVIIPSDYMISRLISENLVQKLDMSNIPNMRYIDDKFLNPIYDKTNEYSVPYTWGTVGIIYNTTMIDDEEEMDSWSVMWDPKYMGEILMFSNPRDSFGIALKYLGYSYNTEDKDQLREAAQLLKDQKYLVQAYVMDEIFDKMEAGEAAIAPYYAGDAITMIQENEDLDFVVPKEGSNVFVDAMCIPVSSKQKEAAEMYINFLNDPEVALANIEYICYSTPNTAALEMLDEETQENEISYPPDEVLANCEMFADIESVNDLTSSLWAEVISTNEEFNQYIVPLFLLLGIIASFSININRRIRKKQNK